MASACPTSVTGLALDRGDELVVAYSAEAGRQSITVDAVIVSVGRRPRTHGIGLQEAGIRIDDRGYVRVDDRLETSRPGIFAVGDVIASPQLAHVAFAEAIAVIKHLVGEEHEPVDYDKVPWGIYCQPEVAYVGLAEQRARDAGYKVTTATHRFSGNSRALIIGDTDGMVKIVSNADGTVLGVHIVGPWATELIAEAYLSVNWEATANDLGNLVHAHPTLSELFR